MIEYYKNIESKKKLNDKEVIIRRYPSYSRLCDLS